MLPGFPKDIKTTKIKRGHYRIDRSDGYSIEVRKSAFGYWYQVGTLKQLDSLQMFKTDMTMGYMAKDQLGE